MSLTSLARAILAYMRNKKTLPSNLTEEEEETFVERVIDAVEIVGGFDIVSEFEEAEEASDDDDDDDVGLFDGMEEEEEDDELADLDDDEDEDDLAGKRHD